MSNAYLYYYPEPGYGLESIDLGGSLSAIQTQSARNVSGGRWETIKASIEGITSQSMVASLRTFEAICEASGLQRSLGGQVQGAIPFGLSADHAKAWAGYLVGEGRPGQIALKIGSNAWSAYSSGAALAAGDWIVIENGYPDFRWESRQVASVSGTTVTLSSGLRRWYHGTVLVRWYRFWPMAYKLSTGPVLTDTVHGYVWRMDLDAISGPVADAAIAYLAPSMWAGTAGTRQPGGKNTLFDLHSAATSAGSTGSGKGVKGGGILGIGSWRQR